MAMARGLGKGLGALLGSSYPQGSEETGSVTVLHVNAIQPNTFQPRKDFSDESLAELAQSIKAQGVLQPVLVRTCKESGKYELIAGERRWRATRLAGLEDIPAIIRDLSDRESLELALIENVQREDLNAIEQAFALHQLQTQFTITQQELAQRTGLSRSHIANLMRLLQLPEDLQTDIRKQRYSQGHGRVLMSITQPESQGLLRQKILEEGLSVRACEQLAAKWKATGRFPFQEKINSEKKAIAVDGPLKRYAEQLPKLLGVQAVRFKGSVRKGAMTISYKSEQELRIILSRLGIHDDDRG